MTCYPDLKSLSLFFGSYENGSNKIFLSERDIALTKTYQSTGVKRFLYVKTDAALNSINNLQYGIRENRLKVGDAAKEFFYRFNNSSRPSALLLLMIEVRSENSCVDLADPAA